MDNILMLKDGNKVSYTDLGDPQGKPLILCHGFPSSSLQAYMMDDSCKKLNLRLLCPDRPGMGDSTYKKDRSLHDWVPFLEKFVDALSIEKFSIIGVSGGCPYALLAGQELAYRIEHISVVCGAPELCSFQDKSDMMLPYRLLMPIRQAPSALFNPFIYVSRWIATQNTNEYPLKWFLSFTPRADREFIEKVGFNEVVKSFVGALQQGASAVLCDAQAYFEKWPIDWATYPKKVHFWHGTDDTNIPCRMTREICNRLPQGQFHELKGEGHYSVSVNYQKQFLGLIV